MAFNNISFTILTHNETSSFEKLLKLIQATKDVNDEIVIVDDYSDNEITVNLLKMAREEMGATVIQNRLNSDFALQKNIAASFCKNDYIFNIDADEYFSESLIQSLKEIIFANTDVEAFRIPRINTVEGITLKHIEQWKWNITSLPTEVKSSILSKNSAEYELLSLYSLILNETVDENGNNVVKHLVPIINYPDMQFRVYKNNNTVKWVGNVHETLTNYKKYGMLPMEKNFSLLHPKTIEKQEKQNAFYLNMTNR